MRHELKIVELDSIPTVGISNELTTSQGENFLIISTLWKRFNSEIHHIGNRGVSGGNWEKFGITSKVGNTYRYLAAIRYNEVMLPPSSMIRQTIAEGRYACITHTGRLSDLKLTVNLIYKQFLPGQNLRPVVRERIGLRQFERYDHRFHWNRPDSVIEIYVPIASQR